MFKILPFVTISQLSRIALTRLMMSTIGSSSLDAVEIV